MYDWLLSLINKRQKELYEENKKLKRQLSGVSADLQNRREYLAELEAEYNRQLKSLMSDVNSLHSSLLSANLKSWNVELAFALGRKIKNYLDMQHQVKTLFNNKLRKGKHCGK